ncbi:hypothetical protein DSM106972_026440 [Dulcicalothrix desertica PCC 7102]|uniref:Uncharacterized protein n=1 Tax=Dulcicalothrix desertica PCC 7102 TaxID=232991 RepID=A0A433VJZ4_9CYAN|nr:hypothetical protein DSM106972_026440 [Dulcicalothrix desertica PCC 7102]
MLECGSTQGFGLPRTIQKPAIKFNIVCWEVTFNVSISLTLMLISGRGTVQAEELSSKLQGTL